MSQIPISIDCKVECSAVRDNPSFVRLKILSSDGSWLELCLTTLQAETIARDLLATSVAVKAMDMGRRSE